MTKPELKLVYAEDLTYFSEKCVDTFVSKRMVRHLTKDEIDKMFVLDEDKVSDSTTLTNRVADGGQFDIWSNFTLPADKTERDGRLVFLNDANVNFHDNFISVPSSLSVNTKNWSALYVEVGAKVVFDGTDNGGIIVNGDTRQDLDGPYCITNFGGEITINGGHYEGCGTCVYGYEGKTIINGGFFYATPINTHANNIHPWTLNLLNDAYNNGTASIEVRGGTFVNFDPSNPNTDDAPSYVPAGYAVRQEVQQNGDIFYIVEKAGN